MFVSWALFTPSFSQIVTIVFPSTQTYLTLSKFWLQALTVSRMRRREFAPFPELKTEIERIVRKYAHFCCCVSLYTIWWVHHRRIIHICSFETPCGVFFSSNLSICVFCLSLNLLLTSFLRLHALTGASSWRTWRKLPPSFPRVSKSCRHAPRERTRTRNSKRYESN